MKTTLETPPNAPAEPTHLYYRSGSSDKVYHVTLQPVGELFAVNFAYGRRGSTLNTGTKTSCPVEYADAQAIYDQLIREKTAKGYTPGADGTPYHHTPAGERATGILPQLLNPLDEDELPAFVNDPMFAMQEKFDGKRVLIRKQGDEVTGINRNGLVIGLPESLACALQALPGDFLLDGECVGDVYHVFDLLECERDLRDDLFAARYSELYRLFRGIPGPLRVAMTAWNTEGKTQMLDQLRAAKREGVVFKHVEAPYVPGRPADGGDQRKHKFYSTLSAVVRAVNPRRSVALQLLSPAGWLPAGNVTIPVNHPVPAPGAVVEVRYLYAMPGSGSLYQPVYLGVRTDVETAACVTGQLKFKADDET